MRNLTPDMLAEYTAKDVEPIIMAEMFFDEGTLRFWSGYGTLTWGDNDFTGGGTFIGISPIQETQETEAKGLVASLNGVPTSIISVSLNQKCRGRPFRLYLAARSVNQYVATEDGTGRVELEDGTGYVLLENSLVDSPYRIFSGLMDYMEFSDNGETADVRLSVENILIVGQRAKVSRYTAEDQRKKYPNDKGLEFINSLQDKEVVW